MTYVCTCLEHIDRPRRSHSPHHRGTVPNSAPQQQACNLGGPLQKYFSLNTQMVVKGKGAAAFLAGIEGAHLEIRPHQILTSPPRPAG